MKKVWCASLLALVSTGVPALAAPPVRQPTGSWVVNFDDAQCLASRNYGTKDNPLIFALKAPAVGNVMQIAVVRSGGGGPATQIDAKLAFDNSKPVSTSMLVFTPVKQRQRVFVINLPLQEFDSARAAASISIRGAEQLNEWFALSQIGSILKLLDECVADLRSVWNVSLDGEPNPPKLKQSAQGDLRGLIRSEEYPGIALNMGQQGRVTFVLLIDESGKVADCTVIETSGVASLDAQGCAKLKERAKFIPAIGMDGKPAKHFWVQRVNWRIEGF